ncbi:UDP-glucuronosyl/UDP-glucosyltransferase [Dillenia turbinata]|uniref:Glycosyltransferase n=1 Tax=Dillenia turbinata TaxID=194707 RepID=A0AAN8V2Z3_9MAGN
MEQQQKANVVIFPTPGMGHLIPLVALAKRLVSHGGLSVTFAIPTTGKPPKAAKAVLEALPKSISHIFLEPISLADLEAAEDTRAETLICLTGVRSLPSLRKTLGSLAKSTRLVALVADLFGSHAFDVAKEFNLKPYIFFPSTAMCLSLFLHLPKLDETVSGQYTDVADPLQIPGCIPVPGRELLDPITDRTNDAYRWTLKTAERYREAEGIIVNTFIELEGRTIKALQEKEPGKPPVYPVGPLIGSDRADHECLKWLDEQPSGSVLYVSFGSGGTLSTEQLNELAYGLEMSEQRFLWVVRSPSDQAANATYFSAESQKEPYDFLPKGFLDRTRGQGLLVASWAPQIQVLSHGSTGGFLSHCGWNSTLESVVHGVPLIAWPLYAEQKMNALMLAEDIKVALRPKPRENGIIGREEIAKVVKSLMEGEEGKRLRVRMKSLKDAAADTLREDGTSTKTLKEVVEKISKP